MSWQGQSPERPHGAAARSATSIAPPGHIQRPLIGPSKAATTPQVAVPLPPARMPVPNDGGVKLALKIVVGLFGICFVIGVVIGFVQAMNAEPTRGEWTTREYKAFMDRCSSGSMNLGTCQCVFDAIRAEYPTYRIYTEQAGPGLRRYDETRNPLDLPAPLLGINRRCSASSS